MDPGLLFHDNRKAERCRVRTCAAGAAVFLLGLVFAAATVESWLEAAQCASLYRERISEKLDLIRSSPGGIDVVFIGNSIVHRDIDPSVFDARMQALGHPTRSLNLGAPRLSILEAEDIVEALHRSRIRPRLVVLHPVLSAVDYPNWSNPRRLEEHDCDGMLTGIRYARGEIVDPGLWDHVKAIKRVGYHVSCWAAGKVNLGRGASVLLPRDILRWTMVPPGIGEQGYCALDDELSAAAARRGRAFRESPDWFRARLKAPHVVPESDPDHELGPGVVAYTRRLLGRIRALGAATVFIVGPSVSDPGDVELSRWIASHDTFPDVRFLNYVHGYGYEDVYDVRLWFDRLHLNRAGAEIFSRRLADDVAPRVHAHWVRSSE